MVDSQSGNSISGALVTITAYQHGGVDSSVVGAVSRATGTFTLRMPRASFAVLSIHALGYREVRDTIDVAIGMQIDRKLKPVSVKLSPVTVEANRYSRAPLTLGSIEAQASELVKLPSGGLEPDLLRSLQLFPGVTVKNEISSAPLVRGGQADQNLFLVDGIPVLYPYHLGGLVGTFSADAVEGMRFYRGVAPAEYGDRLSSTLDLTLKGGRTDSVTGTASLGLLSSAVVVEGGVGTNVTYMLSGRALYLEGLLALIDPHGEVPRYGFEDAYGKLVFKGRDNSSTFRFIGFWNRDQFTSPASDPFGLALGWHNAAIGAIHDIDALTSLHIQTGLSFTQFGSSNSSSPKNAGPNDPNVASSTSHISNLNAHANATWTVSELHVLHFGLAGTLWSGATTQTGLVATSVRTETNSQNQELVLFAQDDWTPFDLFSVEAGARATTWLPEHFGTLEPRISMQYRIASEYSIQASAGVTRQFLQSVSAVDMPLPFDQWYFAGSGAGFARAVQYSIGVMRTPESHDITFTLEGYWKTMDNLMLSTGIGSNDQNTPFLAHGALGEGKSYGAEAWLQMKNDNWMGWLAYTLSWTSYRADAINSGAWFPAGSDTRHQVVLTGSYDLNNAVTLAATWSLHAGQPITTATGQFYFPDLDNGGSPSNPILKPRLAFSEYNGSRLPMYHRLDLSASLSVHLLGFPGTVSLGILNAYNHFNVLYEILWPQYVKDAATGKYVIVYQLKQTGLIPILPTISVSIRF